MGRRRGREERCKRKRGKGDKPWIEFAHSNCRVCHLIFQVSKE